MKHGKILLTQVLMAGLWAGAATNASAITCNKTSELMLGGYSSSTLSAYINEVPVFEFIELSSSKTIQFAEPAFDGLMDNGTRNENGELENCGVRFRIPVTIIKPDVTKIKQGFFEYKHNVKLSKEQGKPCWKFNNEILKGVDVHKFLPKDFCRVR